MQAAVRDIFEAQVHPKEWGPSRARSNAPLFVDLDGTVLRTDTLQEGLLRVLKQNPLNLFRVAYWFFTKGIAHAKTEIAKIAPLKPELLPYNEEVLAHLDELRAEDRQLILMTGSATVYAEDIAKHLKIFSKVYGSTDKVNLVGANKLALIEALYGPSEKFGYIGNSYSDLILWAKAEESIVVSDSAFLKKQASKRAQNVVFLPAAPSPLKDRTALSLWIEAIRMHQWVKNLLLFVPLIAGHRFNNELAIWTCVVAFFAFSACASSVYLLNDLLDLEHDRRHPRKKNRPFAAGVLSLTAGLVSFPLLLGVGLSLGLLISKAFFAMLVSYYVMTLAYSFRLKEKLLIDVMILTLLYNWRILSGAVAIHIALSPWLLGFACFLFYSLALAKRSTELIHLRENAQVKSSGRSYVVGDLNQINVLGIASGLVAILIFALYINGRHVRTLYPHPEFLWPICLAMLYWISRLWMLTGRGMLNHDPLVFALKDRPSHVVALLTIGLFILALL